MLRHLDAVPGIAGDDPSFRRFVLQRIEIFRLSGEERDHRAPLEQAAGVAFAHKLHQIGAEGDIEDRFRIGRGNRLHYRTRVDFALRWPLLVDPLDIGTLFRHQFLEHRNRGLAILGP